MTKALIAILFFLFSATTDASAGVDAGGGNTAFPWFRLGHQPPLPAPQTPGQPGKPNLPPLNDNIQKCFGDVVGVTNCLVQISVSYQTQQIALEPACCNAVQTMTVDCANAVLGMFNNPFFLTAVKQCSAAPPS